MKNKFLISKKTHFINRLRVWRAVKIGYTRQTKCEIIPKVSHCISVYCELWRASPLRSGQHFHTMMGPAAPYWPRLSSIRKRGTPVKKSMMK